MAAVVVVGGCNTKSTSGGPGATGQTGREKGGTITQAEDTFSLDPPNTATTIKQGESKQVTIGIRRGKNFAEDVALSMDGLPKGVTADPASPAIKKGEEKATVTLKAADDAALGDFEVKLRGKPTKGAEAANTLKITVDKK